MVQARGAPRQNATAKDSEWVRTRQALEKDKPSDVNEVLLCQEHVCNLTQLCHDSLTSPVPSQRNIVTTLGH